MGKRSVEVFQTVNDIRMILEDEERRLTEPLMLFAHGLSTTCPEEIDPSKIGDRDRFLLSRSSFFSDLKINNFGNGTCSIDVLESPVILVRRSEISKCLINRGRYWFLTTHVVSGERTLREKRHDFVVWADSLLRRVRTKSRRRETYPPYYFYFLPDADQWIGGLHGSWSMQAEFHVEPCSEHGPLKPSETF